MVKGGLGALFIQAEGKRGTQVAPFVLADKLSSFMYFQRSSGLCLALSGSFRALLWIGTHHDDWASWPSQYILEALYWQWGKLAPQCSGERKSTWCSWKLKGCLIYLSESSVSPHGINCRTSGPSGSPLSACKHTHTQAPDQSSEPYLSSVSQHGVPWLWELLPTDNPQHKLLLQLTR